MNKYIILTVLAKIPRLIIRPMLQPLLPVIATTLMVTTHEAKYVWLALTIGFLIANIYLCGWGDRTTIKPIFVIVLPIAIIGTSLSMIANIYCIQCGVFCIAFGANVVATLGPILLREIDQQNAQESIAINSTISEFAPIIFLVITGALISYNWRYIFLTLFIIFLITWILALYTPELPRNFALDQSKLWQRGKTILLNKKYLALLLLFISYLAIMSIIFVVLPFTAINFFHIPAHIFSYLLIPSYILQVFGSYLCFKLHKRLSITSFISFVLFCSLCGLILFLLFNFLPIPIIYIIIFGTGAYCFGVGMIFPYLNAKIILLVDDSISLTADALFGILYALVSIVAVILATHLNDHNSLQFAVLALGFFSCAVIGAIIYCKLECTQNTTILKTK